jgi:ribonuclease P protein component
LTFEQCRGLRPGCAGGAVSHEENVSTEQSAAKANPRIPRPHGDSGRPKGTEAATGQGTAAADGLDSTEAAGVTRGRSVTFPKHARLRKRGDYLRVQQHGRRQHTDSFVVLSAPTSNPNSRFGITVSTRVGNAVARNRVKRMIREIVRPSWRNLQPPGDVVIIAKPGAAQTTHAKAAIQLKRALGVEV